MFEVVTAWERVPPAVRGRWSSSGGGREHYVEGVRCVAVSDLEDLERVAEFLGRRVEQGSWLGVDTETTSPWPPAADLVGVSLSADDRLGFYIPLGHSFAQNLPLPEVLS